MSGTAEARRGRSSLVRRLIWSSSAWVLLALIATGALLTTFFRDAAVRRLEQDAQEIVDILVAGTSVEGGVIAPPSIADARSDRLYSGKYWQVGEATASGEVRALARSRSLYDWGLPSPPSTTRLLSTLGEPVGYDAVGPRGEPLRIVAQAGVLPGRTTPLVFLTGIDRRPVDADVARFATLTWGALLALGAGLVGAVFVQVRFGLRPLFELGREVADVRTGRKQRLENGYPVEVEPLANELNALLDHNQEVVERQRTHVGNLAHALKTPLAVMLTEAGAERGALPEVVRRQADLMRAQVDHHLRRARAAARAQNVGERTPVEPVLDELAVMLERVFQDKGVTVDWRAPEDLCFRGERQDLQEIAGNILENACKWAKARVRAAAEKTGEGTLRIVVEDDGPGLPADQREAVFKRGARLDETAPGSGLGLSIVDELVRAYGGRIALDESGWGGLKVVFELPAAD